MASLQPSEHRVDVNRLYRESRGESWWVRLLLPVIALLWLGELAVPISQLLDSSAATWWIALGLAGAAAFVAIYVWVLAGAARVRSGGPSQARAQLVTWLPSVLMALIAILMGVAYGPAWLGLFIFAAVGSGLHLDTRDAGWTIAALTLVAGLIGLIGGDSLSDLAQGGLLIAGIGASVTTVGYTIRVTRELRAARAGVARLAVAEERLRFARDLHDLLGHSLSLVALKCDLADQLVELAPARARNEIQQAAGVTREALREVRETVAGYRRPTLSGELAGAEEMLSAAGIGYHMDGELPQLGREVEEALAWTVREGITNVIRHSAARRCVIRLREVDGRVVLEIVNDGAGSRHGVSAGDTPGHGLRGLAERLAVVGGACEADAQDGNGFRLSAWVPAHSAADSLDADSVAASGRSA